jgi:hypothetical protein
MILEQILKFAVMQVVVLMRNADINSAQERPIPRSQPSDHAGPPNDRRVNLTLQRSFVPQSGQAERFDPMDHWGKKE